MEVKSDCKLWTGNLIKICAGNFLLYVSLYMIIPVFPIFLVGEFQITFFTAGLIMALFVSPLFLVGPFYSYLIDTYKRKSVCLISYLAVIFIIGGYSIAGSLLWIIILRILQGAMFGIASSMGNTLAIDVTVSPKRNACNNCYNRSSLWGMLIGPMIGITIYINTGVNMVLYASVAIGLLGWIFTSLIRVAFRAPIGVSLCSLDRFLLSRAWLPALNLIFHSFSYGLLFVSVLLYANLMYGQNMAIIFFFCMIVGFILSIIANRTILVDVEDRWKIISGLCLTVLAFILIAISYSKFLFMLAAVLMGSGMGLSEFLHIFVKLSKHCQRGTATNTYLIAWETGIAAGIITTSFWIDVSLYASVFRTGVIMALIALLLYVLFTRKYFEKNRIK